jgi:hypothetical protein
MEKVGNVAAIKRYFEADGGKKVTMDEMKALTAADRDELGAACAAALGLEISLPPGVTAAQ